MIASAADESDTVIPNKAYITEKESGRVFNVDFSNGSTISTDIKDEKDTVKLNIELAATLCLLKKYMELSFGVEITDEGLQKILVSEIGEDFFKNIK